MFADFNVFSGVPQGSIVGPLLCNIFVADLIDQLDVHALMYEDNLKLFHQIITRENCQRLQESIDKVHIWCVENDLQINVAAAFLKNI